MTPGLVNVVYSGHAITIKDAIPGLESIAPVAVQVPIRKGRGDIVVAGGLGDDLPTHHR